MTMHGNTMAIYGATGYIGELTTRIAVGKGLEPVLIGRGKPQVEEIARRHDLPWRVAALDDPHAVDEALRGISVVLNAAGPFGTTAGPLLDACIRTRTHYLDLSGEAVDFEAVRRRHTELVEADVMAMPGGGFGVVPTDAVAVHLAGVLPGATSLELSFQTVGGVSRGTAGTLVAGLPAAGWQRRGGALVPSRAAEQRRTIPDGLGGHVTVVTNPWRADVVSAAESTGISDISTFTAMPGPVTALARIAPKAPWLLTSRSARGVLGALLRRLPPGPSDQQLSAGRTVVHGKATAPDGSAAEAILIGPEAYLFTAHAAAELLARTATGAAVPGFRTPAQVHGPDLALAVPGTSLRDLARRAS
ncbi:saccharopine dehydrogenase family protein [Lentzea sp. NEAU-D7]|uniref:saccharopine dehydrogenase family protein n=1 Tax=Lentzea sp. NEAU-D7 TaxID=2994667 RepID=UPI00224A65C3|nr:saccharopine dehydrogenase NADP-binding domain-containing protein [Lentzea sp. NEAU-D7]MCX2947891.1 saccharopine dehydrogenase NADP-binding domain-containing protein [Lentzea sp. NEAU-D7]